MQAVKVAIQAIQIRPRETDVRPTDANSPQSFTAPVTSTAAVSPIRLNDQGTDDSTRVVYWIWAAGQRMFYSITRAVPQAVLHRISTADLWPIQNTVDYDQRHLGFHTNFNSHHTWCRTGNTGLVTTSLLLSD